MRPGLTAAQIRSLPATIDLVTAGAVFGVGRTKAYQLAHAGNFPCRVLRVGRSYRVATADLLTAVGLPPHDGEAQGDQSTSDGQHPPQGEE